MPNAYSNAMMSNRTEKEINFLRPLAALFFMEGIIIASNINAGMLNKIVANGITKMANTGGRPFSSTIKAINNSSDPKSAVAIHILAASVSDEILFIKVL